MKIMTWNVQGVGTLSSPLLSKFLNENGVDIILLQELKKSFDRSGLALFIKNANYDYIELSNPNYFVGFLVKNKPLGVLDSYQNPLLQDSGRVLIIEYKQFYVVNVYLPFSKDASARAYKKRLLSQLLLLLKKLLKNKEVILGGDFNIVHSETGINIRNQPGNLDFEREFMSSIKDLDFTDSFRNANTSIKSSFYKRLDYVFLSSGIKNYSADFVDTEGFYSSDHVPYQIILDQNDFKPYNVSN